MAAGHFWDDIVMKGELPAKIEAPNLNLEDEPVVDLGYRLAAFKVIEKEAKLRVSETQGRIAALEGDCHGLSTGKMERDIATLNRAHAWNEECILEIARAADVDPDQFRTRTDKLEAKVATRFIEDRKTPGDDGEILGLVERTLDQRLCNEWKLDAAALAAHLEAIDVSTLAAMDVKESFLLTRKKAGAGVERLAELRDNVSELIEAMETVVVERIPVIRGMAQSRAWTNPK